MAQISKEYAEALFALACEEQQEEKFLDALNTVEKLLVEEPEYAALLSSPGIPLGDRLEALESALAGVVPEYVLSWMQLLCEKGRIGAFSECVKEYKALLAAKQSVVTARVTSAVELTNEEAAALKEKLEKISGHTVLLDRSTDASLLGGLIVEIEGKVLDGSLRHRLHMVKEVMEQ